MSLPKAIAAIASHRSQVEAYADVCAEKADIAAAAALAADLYDVACRDSEAQSNATITVAIASFLGVAATEMASDQPGPSDAVWAGAVFSLVRSGFEAREKRRKAAN